MPTGIPAAESPLDEALVRSLLREQFSQFAKEPVTAVGEGWDNALFRLGEKFVVRLPRRAAAASLIEKEHEFLPEIAALASSFDIRVPVHSHYGGPGCGYPWHWSIAFWIPGFPADGTALLAEDGERLGKFLRCLHRPARTGAPPHNPFRGIPLKDRANDMELRIARVRANAEPMSEHVARIWSEALAATPAEEAVWIHGDLHAGNVLVENGRITGIIDWGDLTSGDAATDLASLWTVLESEESRRQAVAAYSPQPSSTWLRARGWALLFSVVLLGSEHPRQVELGRKILHRLDQSNVFPNAR